MKKRLLYHTIKKRLEEDNPLIQVVIGPRQIGKTTALKQVLNKTGHYYSADGPVPLDYSNIGIWWEKAKKSGEKILGIDEIQKVPGWSEVIKKIWDQDKSLKVILTGSSSILMEKGLTETLAGRFELIRAEHWNYEEASRIFNVSLQDFIEFGCYPGAMRFINDKNRWSQFLQDSIVEPVIGRDLLQLNPVKSPVLLRQLFHVSLKYPAQVISLNKLQGDIKDKGTVPTLKNYLKLLKDSFLISGIDKYSTRSIKLKSGSPKIIIHDNALLRAFEKPVAAKLSPQRFGRYFENIVGQRFIEAGWDTFYWKERNLEVDFVVLGPNGEKWAIEVKSSKTNIQDLRGLFHFCKKFKTFEPKLISLTDQQIDGVVTLPIKKVLSMHRKY